MTGFSERSAAAAYLNRLADIYEAERKAVAWWKIAARAELFGRVMALRQAAFVIERGGHLPGRPKADTSEGA